MDAYFIAIRKLLRYAGIQRFLVCGGGFVMLVSRARKKKRYGMVSIILVHVAGGKKGFGYIDETKSPIIPFAHET